MTTSARIIIPFILMIFLSGCVSNNNSGGGAGWPMQSFPHACTGHTIPFEPFCVDTILGDGFKYRDQFNACKQTVQAYEHALNEFVRCKADDLKGIFDNLIRDVGNTYNCYIDYYATRETGDPTGRCQLVAIPVFHARYQANGLDLYFGIPACVRESNTKLYIPKHKYDLDTCKRQVEEFLGKAYSGFSSYATSAQKQYDEYLSNLRREVDTKIDDTVRQFNCKARGEKFCI